MSLWDTRNSTTSPFSFLMGTMSSRHQNWVPGRDTVNQLHFSSGRLVQKQIHDDTDNDVHTHHFNTHSVRLANQLISSCLQRLEKLLPSHCLPLKPSEHVDFNWKYRKAIYTECSRPNMIQYHQNPENNISPPHFMCSVSVCALHSAP